MRKIPTFFWEYPKHTPPVIDLNSYRLHIRGDMDKEQILSLEQLDDILPEVIEKRRFYCVNGWSLEAVWRGYSLASLLEIVQPHASSEYIRATSCGDYEDTTKISELVQGGAMLVTHMDGEPLTPKRGSPIRLMIFDRYQFKGVKQLQTIEVVHNYRPGTWQKIGYGDATIQPYPHLAIDRDVEMMPDQDVLTP